MQKVEGEGLAFVHAGGTVAKRELRAGQALPIDTGGFVAMTPDVNFETRYVGKGEGAVLVGFSAGGLLGGVLGGDDE